MFLTVICKLKMAKPPKFPEKHACVSSMVLQPGLLHDFTDPLIHILFQTQTPKRVESMLVSSLHKCI